VPLYEYESDGGHCKFCKDRFEVLQRLGEPALTACPECGQPCHRVFSSFASVKSIGDGLSPTKLAQKGFTQYKRAGDGQYEKTCGQGPDLIGRN
jgi:putative FmdB family regulatory protein